MPLRDEHFEVEVAATPEDVWWALTTVEGLTAWFGAHAVVDLRVEGERVVGWGEVEIPARFEILEPGSRLRVAYLADGEPSGAEEWLIESRSGATRVRLVNTMPDEGVDDWDDFYGDIRRGWRLFLASLRFALGEAERPEREVQHCFLPAAGDRAEIRRMLDSGLAARADLTNGMGAAVVDPPHSLLLTRPDRSLFLDIEGSGDGQVVYAQAASHGAPSVWMEECLGVVRASLSGIVPG